MISVRGNTGQRGQAMVELVAMGGVATLLFLAIWYLGKFHDIQASTIQAARYAAWERTVHAPADKTDAQLELQTRARLFTWNQAAYKATDSRTNGAAWGRQSANWQSQNGETQLVERPRDVQVRLRAEGFPGQVAAVFGSSVGAITRLTGAITGGESLPAGGMYIGTVTVALNNVAELPAPLNALNLKLTESNAIATNNWDANGPKQTASRTMPFAPATVLTRLNFLINPLKWALSIIEPSIREFKPGQICPDIVPNDRVEGKTNLPAYAGAQPCY